MTRLCVHITRIVSYHARRLGTSVALKSTILPSCHPLSHIKSIQPRLFSVFASQSAEILSPPGHTTVPASEITQRQVHPVARIARAAAQAVRVTIHEGNFRDAFYVVNSALQSPLERGITPPTASRRLLNPMNFGRPVPTRLVVHTMIHALIRDGHTIRAGREIEKLLAMGVRFRCKTIEASVGLLCTGSSLPLAETTQDQDEHDWSTKPSGEDWEGYHTLYGQSARLIPETRLAIDLLTAARQSRHRRTERMYGWVVDACLLQGEIFVATLLFVVLVKDWQLRKVIKSSVGDPEQFNDTSHAASGERRKPNHVFHDARKRILATEIGLDGHRILIPYPQKSILQSILTYIDRRLFSGDPHAISQSAKADCERSLAYLVTLVDQRSLPFGQLSPLIRCLYSCHDERSQVEILDDYNHFHVDLYTYSHKVLLRLCQTLPSQKHRPSCNHPELLPPIDTRAYNSLIHYALRHRLSPALADAVIEHMTVYRKPPLQPDITTYNVLLHSASTLRHSHLAENVLNVLHKRHINTERLSPNPRPSRTLPPDRQNKIFKHFLRHAPEDLTVPSIQTHSDGPGYYARTRPIRADAYTLCNYITHLARTGRAEVIADTIFQILPELHIVNHPATVSPAPDDLEGIHDASSRRESIQRAIEYGPYVFSTLLNALQKAGRTGLAERVWLLAREAERASWVQPKTKNAHAPWCLPIHAYTSMMQCYADESKRGRLLTHGSHHSKTLSYRLLRMRGQQPSEQQRTGKMYVKGWAHFFLKVQAQELGHQNVGPALRWKTARQIGHLLLKSMRSGAMSVWQELMTLQPENVQHVSPQWAAVLNSLNLPVADARFFNAVLELFGRSPRMQARRLRASPSWWTRKLRISRKVYVDTGQMPMAYDPILVEISGAMAKAGYTLPLGLRRALVGRVNSSVKYAQRQERILRPFGFPRPVHPDHRMFSLPVRKSRGLPLGRSKPEVMRRRRIEQRRTKVKSI